MWILWSTNGTDLKKKKANELEIFTLEIKRDISWKEVNYYGGSNLVGLEPEVYSSELLDSCWSANFPDDWPILDPASLSWTHIFAFCLGNYYVTLERERENKYIYNHCQKDQKLILYNLFFFLSSFFFSISFLLLFLISLFLF